MAVVSMSVPKRTGPIAKSRLETTPSAPTNAPFSATCTPMSRALGTIEPRAFELGQLGS